MLLLKQTLPCSLTTQADVSIEYSPKLAKMDENEHNWLKYHYILLNALKKVNTKFYRHWVLR